MAAITTTRTTHGFVLRVVTVRPSTTQLFIEDRIANMIDQELYRQHHLQDFENEWMEKNREAVLKSASGGPTASSMLTDEAMVTDQQLKRDQFMASSDPQRYCADRCIATGNCDVYEDIFKFSPQQVLEFCEECVLSDKEEPCDVPDAFFSYDDDDNNNDAQGDNAMAPPVPKLKP
eukprot:CAMPEP_0198153972 /NCGR_PEP_ID=MMETSP1443-20131203/66603_1 /TAXON_ID=186043 /ORGANISM="Entomoneis sp., Strain CCMP2396" /LENGTH=175 /DNA_ID=CAMNT_0043820515 /DNA_START=120 /DNA_END=647 /DNA_ORIENTATION=+